jgi:hypothetical protein
MEEPQNRINLRLETLEKVLLKTFPLNWNQQKVLYHFTIIHAQSVPEGKVNIQGGHIICHSKQRKCVYEACPKSVRLYFFPEKPVKAGWQI